MAVRLAVLALEAAAVAAIVFGVWMLAEWWAAIAGGVLVLLLIQAIRVE